MGLTTTQFIDELRRSLGNRTDITPERYVRWLNWALLDICGFHRKRAFAPKRFHELEEQVIFSVPDETGLIISATTKTVGISGTNIETSSGYYNDSIVTVDGETHLVLNWSGTVATILGEWETLPVIGETATLQRRRFDIENDVGISPKESLWIIEEMEEVYTGDSVIQVKWEDIAHIPLSAIGSPEKFARRGSNILFSTAPVGGTTYRLYTYNFPVLLDPAFPDEQSSLTDDWDEIIILGAMWRGFDKLMEPDRSKEAKMGYENELHNRQDAYFREDMFIPKSIKYRRK